MVTGLAKGWSTAEAFETDPQDVLDTLGRAF
jgi:hypothetical protein